MFSQRESPASPILAAALLAAAIWIVYWPAVDTPFIFDDSASIVGNPSIGKLWPLWGDDGHHGPLNPAPGLPFAARPLVNLSMALNYHFGQLDPRGYHIVNIALHVLAALLLWRIVGRTLRLEYFHGRFDRAAGPLSFVAALVWALHPLDTESVAYLTQRTELMMGLCYLATLYGSLRYWSATRPAARGAWLGLSSLACLSGMLSKETMVSAPVIVLLFERTFIAGSFRGAIRASWPLYLALALAWVPLAAIHYQGVRTPMAGFDQGIPAWVWWFTQAKVLLLYLKLAVWPAPLLIHYDMPYLETAREAWPWLLAVSLLGIASLWLLWKRKAAGFVAIWVLAILSPTLVIPLTYEVAAERRMYLPLAALAAFAIVGGYEVARRVVQYFAARADRKSSGWGTSAISTTIGFVLATVLGTLSASRLAVFRDELALWQDAEIHAPHDSLVHVNLAICLEKAGRKAEAMRHFGEAVRLKPNSSGAHFNLAHALEESNRPREAIAHYQEAVRWNPDLAQAHNNLGLLLASLGNTQQAIEHYELALRSHPELAQAHGNLAILLAGAGQTDAAIDHLDQALRLKPSAEAYANLAAVYAHANRPADAIAAAEKALQLAREEGQNALANQLEASLSAYRGSQAGP